MARPGVTYFDVAQAAKALQEGNELPTIDRIRQKLGTGSNSTIANHLKQWKSEQMPNVIEVPKTTIPTSLVSQLQGLWDELKLSAKEDLVKKTEVFESEKAELLAKKEASEHKLNMSLSTMGDLEAKLKDKKEIISRSESTINQLNQTISEHKTQISIQENALENGRETIETLKQQLKHVSENLEHFQREAQKQRDRDTLRFASELNQWQQKQHLLEQKHEEERVAHQKLKMTFDQESFKSNQLLLESKQTKDQLTNKIEQLAVVQTELKNATALNAKIQADYEQKVKDFDNAQVKIEEKTRWLQKVTTHNQQLTSESQELSKKLDILKEAEEKWRQEKEQLVAELASFRKKNKKKN